MSRQTWFDIQETVARHQALLQEQEHRSSEGYGWMDLEQMKFIVSLSPAGPLDGFIHALEHAHLPGPLDGFLRALRMMSQS